MDRRTFPRITLHLPVAYRGAGVLGTAFVTTLSRGGCTLAMGRVADLPLYLELTIALPDLSEPVQTGAAIRWRGDETFGMEYLLLTKSDERALARFVETLRFRHAQIE